MSTSTTQIGARDFEQTGVYRELAELKQRIRALETEWELMDEKQESHLHAKQRDARDVLKRGEEMTLVVEEPPEENDGVKAISHANGIVIFVDPGKHELERADVIRTRISDVGENHAHALLIDEEGGEQ